MVSSPGINWSIRERAVSERVTYLEMADFDSGTRVKILFELKSRSLMRMSFVIPDSESRRTP